MSKNLNKIVAFAIGVSVFTGSVVPVMAADTKTTASVTSSSTTNKSKIYKVEDAVQDAIANSDKLAILNSSISLYDAQKDVYEEYDDMGMEKDLSGKNVEDTIDKIDIQISQNKQKRDYLQDYIKYNTTNSYNSIVLANEKIALAEENLKIKTDSYNQSKLKQQLGLSTQVSLKSEELELTKLKDDLEAQKKSVNDSIYKLGLTTGKDLSKSVFSNSIEYNKFSIDGSFESYMEKSIKDMVKYDLDLIEISKDDLSDRKDDDEHKFPKQSDYVGDKPTKPTKPADNASEAEKESYNAALNQYSVDLAEYQQNLSNYQTALITYMTYYSDKFTNDQSVHTLNITEDAYRNSMKSNYTKLQGIEDSIKQAQSGLEILNENVRHTKLQYDLGLVTKNQYDQIVYKQKETQLSLETAIDGYNQLKGMLEQPWMMAVANG